MPGLNRNVHGRVEGGGLSLTANYLGLLILSCDRPYGTLVIMLRCMLESEIMHGEGITRGLPSSVKDGKVDILTNDLDTAGVT